MSRITVKDVMDRCNACISTVYRWIDKGYLKAVRVGVGRGQHWEIEYEDFQEFLQSCNYPGHPEDIHSSEPFTRVPELEECYPINLLISVHTIAIDSEEYPPDIWDYDIRQFKQLVTLLTDREQKVIHMRYQFGMTLDEVAAAFGLTRERIRQIQLKAERKLRHWSAKKGIYVVDRKKYDDLKTEHRSLLAEYDKLLAQYEVLSHEKVLPDGLPVIEIGKITLEELDLSVRSYNCLKRAGIDTLKDILDFDENQQNTDPDHQQNRTWMNIRNLGKKSIMEIAKKVHDYCRYRIRYYDVANKKYAGEIPICPGESLVIGSVYFYCGEE